MFGSRRHRPPQPALTLQTANPNAATAAAAVFKRHEPPPVLSSAAAAAAMHAMPAPPTNVAEVQTKRTMRRSGSVSSSGTAPDAQGRPGLQRRGSSGSMTERTFRSPSPHRPGSSAGTRRLSRDIQEAPPVPALPQRVETQAPPPAPSPVPASTSGSGVHRTKSLGLKTTPVRVASQKLANPGSSSWFGAAHVGDPSNVRTSDAAMATPPSSSPKQAPIHQAADPREQRPSSRSSSVNFSYPARMRLGSPPASPVESRGYEFPLSRGSEDSQPPVNRQHQRIPSDSTASTTVRNRPSSVSSVQSLVYDPNSRRMVPRADLLAVEQRVRGASEKPVRKKKHAPSKAGSHLSQGTLGRTKSTSTDAREVHQEQMQQPIAASQEYRMPGYYAEDEPIMQAVEPEDEEPAVKAIVTSPRLEAKRSEQHDQRGSRIAEPSAAGRSTAGRSSDYEQTESVRFSQVPRRQPSMVKEEPELEVDDRSVPRPHSINAALDSVPMRTVYEPSAVPFPSPIQVEQLRSTITSPPPAPPEPEPEAQKAPVELPASTSRPLEISAGEPAAKDTAATEERSVSYQPLPSMDIRRERTHSNSPVRTAHFGPVQDSLVVRHNPPPRSISPRKSALKQQSPPRGASPTDDTSEASGSVTARDELALPRKKSVRVSFDDENTVVVGQAAGAEQADSPVAPGPQATRRPWYSNIGRSKKKDFASMDDDEVMQPRPALPSFGSIREKKPREKSPSEEERPLVRPLADPVNSPSLPATPMFPSIEAVNETAQPHSEVAPAGQSSDYAIGALLAREQEQSAKNPANISKLREPLPPVVTSVEGGGYVSDSSSSAEEEDQSEATETSAPAPVTTWNAAAPQTDVHDYAEEQQEEVTHQPLNGSTPVNGSTKAPAELSAASEEPPAERQVETVSSQPIPAISISHASPSLPSATIQPKDYLDVPGGFPEDESDVSASDREPFSSKIPVASEASATAAPLRQVTFEPVVQAADAISTPHTPATVAATHTSIAEDDEDETGSSIYSDAYEDLSDLEGDGFQSLDAVVDSPISAPSRQAPQRQSAPQAAKAPEPPLLQPDLSSATTAVESQPSQPPADDWEKHKAYWRSLTTEKRAQLEREAMEDAGVDGDLEEQSAEKKPGKKKSIERRNSERKALAVHMAQQMMLAEQAAQAEKKAAEKIAPEKKVTEKAPQPKPVKKAKREQAVPQPQPQSTAADPDRTYMIKPGTRVGDDGITPVFRTTMRAERQPPPKQSQTTRDGDVPLMRKSMRSAGPSAAQGAQAPRSKAKPPVSMGERHMSYPPPGGAATAGKGRGRVASDASSAAASNTAAQGTSSFMPTTLRRHGSGSSESSFRRSKIAGRMGEGFGFRSSMRQSPPPVEPSARPPSSRFSLRSLSPGGSGLRSSNAPTMRQTLRSPSEGSGGKSSGMRMSSFGLSGTKSAPKIGGSKFSSRFGDDSSDEDAPTASRFRSRFDESSEDEDVPPMPIAIPKSMRSAGGPPAGALGHRRQQASMASTALPEEEESEELPDSDDEKGRPSATKTAAGNVVAEPSATTVRRSRSGRGELVASPVSPTLGNISTVETLRPASRRSSFMAVLRRRKPSDGAGRVQRLEYGLDSAARRDTKLERTPQELNAIRSNSLLDRDVATEAELDDDEHRQPPRPSTATPAAAVQRSPRLQKRVASLPIVPVVGGSSANWPLAGAHDDDGEGRRLADDPEKELRRPSTSGNLGTRTMSNTSAAASARPGFMQRRTLSSGGLLNITTTNTSSKAGGDVVDSPMTVEPTADGGFKKKKKFSKLRRMFGLDD